jgi:hypothetical protein
VKSPRPTQQEEDSAIARSIDWTHYNTFKTQGLSDREIARQWGIPWSTFQRERQRYTAAHPDTPAHPGTLEGHWEVMEEIEASLPEAPHISPADDVPLSPPEVHPDTPAPQSTTAHPSTPGYTELPTPQPTSVYLSTPLSDEVAVRLLSLLPDLEVIVARERDRQRLVSTPIGTPRHTTKKTYVVDTLYVDLIERYAQAEGVELKDVVNLAFHEFFERRQYLPGEPQ